MVLWFAVCLTYYGTILLSTSLWDGGGGCSATDSDTGVSVADANLTASMLTRPNATAGHITVAEGTCEPLGNDDYKSALIDSLGELPGQSPKGESQESNLIRRL